MKLTWRFVFSFVFFTGQVRAQEFKVAVAANAQFVMEKIGQAFREESGQEAQLIVSSSGKLTAQIQNGAPFDVFLSADVHYPAALHRAGLTQAAPRVYAYGTLVLWTAANLDLSKGVAVLTRAECRKIALANPKLAPYGGAAVDALTHAGLYERVRTKLVYGESIAQVNQYVLSGSASAGFTAKSVVMDPALKGKGTWIEVDRKAYQPIAQGAVLLKGARSPAARKFYDFLFSARARAIFQQYGYLVSEP
ncbi:MAG: molybdate ABC transporter substrate-binding protein [Ferruginibacter sp.]|nr:molybdate ABC transporter substrate-binding protein [Cytophagales bacterium]